MSLTRTPVPLLALCLLAGGAAAQESPSQAPAGTNPPTAAAELPMRAATPLAVVHDATLHPLLAPTSWPAAPLTVDALEERGARKASVAGGVIGFVVGGAAGGALGCLANEDSYGVFCGGQDDTKVFVGVALGGLVGAALGALLFR